MVGPIIIAVMLAVVIGLTYFAIREDGGLRGRMTVQVSQVILACLIVIGFFGSLIILLIYPASVTDTNREGVMIMIGALVAGFSGLIGYFFGSSAGSAAKTKLMAKSEPIIDLNDEVKSCKN